MTTTHLFVELLVIGFGALIWVLLFVAALTGTDVGTLQKSVEAVFKAGAGSSFVAFLPIAYVLGILTDRIADRILSSWDKRHRVEVFGTDLETYFDHRRTLVLKGGALWEHLEYLRSRLRICRGWVANALLTMVALGLYCASLSIRSQSVSWKALLVAEVVLLVLLLTCLFAWQKMNQGEYSKTERQAKWLLTRASTSEKRIKSDDAEKKASGESSVNPKATAGDEP